MGQDQPIWAFALAIAAFAATPAPAAAQLGEDGSEINSSDYTIDLYTGVVQGGAQMIGLGGAFVAIAEGVDGNLVNAATAAHRPGYSVDHFDYWLGFAFNAPFSVGDFYNTGGFSSEAGFDQSGFTYLAPALNLQWGPFGVGATLEIQTARINSEGTAAGDDDDATIRFQFMKLRLQAAYQFLEGQLIVGFGGIVLVQRAVGGQNILDEEHLYVTDGLGYEVGMIYRPNRRRYRLAASFEGPIETSAAQDGDVIENDFYLPRSVYKPWETRLGFAYQFGGRPLNPVWQNVDQVVQDEVGDLWASMSRDERSLYRTETWRRLRREYRAQDRRYLLISTAVHIVGRSREAVSVESFLTQRVQHSGDDVNLSPRWGLETDLIPNWIRLRSGGYVEPSRVELTNPRFHYTVGLDFKVGWWDVFGVWSEDYLWRLGLSMDIARDYFVGSFGIGGWY
ncbi:MAG: hypothetical protein JRH11_09945 [Deltaproteobacteria bacterium]|nr:hypothetical protein [Deltaproteobacteria bacterium]